MASDFPHPIDLGTLEAFTHPHRDHPLHHPLPAVPVTYAGNGYIALRCHRGLWIATDFPVPAEPTLKRLQDLPWTLFDKTSDTARWQALHHARPALSKTGPTGIVIVAERYLIRRTHLQLIARLPRAEILTHGGHEDTMAFRFSGGTGLIPRDLRIAGPPRTSPFTRPHDLRIFDLPREHYDGVTLNGAPPLPPKLREALTQQGRKQWNAQRQRTGWPPPDPTD